MRKENKEAAEAILALAGGGESQDLASQDANNY